MLAACLGVVLVSMTRRADAQCNIQCMAGGQGALLTHEKITCERAEQVPMSAGAASGGGPGVGNGLPQETAFCRKRPAVGNSLYQETAETILRHLFRKK